MRLICLTLLVACTGCGDAPDNKKAPDADGPLVAKWVLDHEANLAVPVCAHCATPLERSHKQCDKCGNAFVIKSKTIDCPECEGKKHCAHCAVDHKCDVCEGKGHCTVCEGAGKVDGETCPDCDGKNHCAACAEHAAHGKDAKCEHCDGSHECANCANHGTIELK